MKPNVVVLAASPALISFSPEKKENPRRLRVTLWQTHAWSKTILKPRKRSRERESSGHAPEVQVSIIHSPQKPSNCHAEGLLHRSALGRIGGRLWKR
jgi:hypothetical protein